MNRSFVRTAACTLAAAAVTAVLLAVPASAPSFAASFSLSDSNCSSFTLTDNGGGNFTLNCVAGGGGGGVLSCSISLSAGSPTVSTAETLTASCSNAAGAVTYTWSAAAGNAGACPAITQEASPNQNKADVPAPGGSTALNCTYNLSANDGTTTVTPSKAISYSTGGGGGGGGGGGNISCNGFNATHVITATWTSNGLYYTANAGGFGPNDAVVVKFTTSSVTTSTKLGSFNAVEYSDPPTPRYGSLSANACDFSVGLPVQGGGSTVFSGDIGASAYFTLFNSRSSAATLQPNTTYYINLANMPGACGGSCNMQITVNKPGGT